MRSHLCGSQLAGVTGVRTNWQSHLCGGQLSTTTYVEAQVSGATCEEYQVSGATGVVSGATCAEPITFMCIFGHRPHLYMPRDSMDPLELFP